MFILMSIRNYGITDVIPVFRRLLPIAFVNQLVQNSKRRFYQRIFTPTVLLWCLIYQRLSPDHSLDEVVAHVKSGAVDYLSPDPECPISQRIRSESTAAYSNGRQRFPIEVVEQTMTHTAKTVQQSVSSWHGHQVVLIDGTTFIVRPTDELIKHYGVQSNQHGTNYWVQIRGVATFCLRSGVVLSFREAPIQTSEQELAFRIIERTEPDTVLVGDINFGVFSVAQTARHHQDYVLLRLSAPRARKIAKRCLRPGDDMEVSWSPSRQDQLNDDMPKEPIQGRVLCFYLQRPGFRTKKIFLFTTLLDKTIYTPEELFKLYGYRLHAELNLRYIKDNLDIADLRGKSPDIVRKELYSGLLVYNLIRACMVEAAAEENVSPLELSFTSCWRRIRPEVIKLSTFEDPEEIERLILRLILRLRKCKLPKRKVQRFEPRAVRKRPRTYPILKGDRKQARKIYHQQLKEQAKAQKC